MRNTTPFNEALAQRLPLPLAQLYRRAHNAKSGQDRHHAAYYLWEAALKLLGCAAVASYLESGRTPDSVLAELLRNLARPAVGHWWGIGRALCTELADDAPFAALRELLLGKTRDDLPRVAGLDAAMASTLDGRSGSRTTVRLIELFDRLVRYRNREFGHGAVGQRSSDYYDEMGGALLAGLPQLLERLDVLAGSKLVYLADVRRLSSGTWLVERYELLGEAPRRLESLEVSHEEAASLLPGRVYLLGQKLLGLHPLLGYDFEANEALFLNARRGRQRIEYLCYTTGGVVQHVEPAASNALLAEWLEQPVEEPAQQEEAQPQAQHAPVDGEQEQSHLGEFALLGVLGRGGMGVAHRAWQPSLSRQVALKCLLNTGDARAETRFAREIAALGKVEHPHLVRIFTSGAEGDRWFYAMELVEGATLAAVCNRLSEQGSTAAAVDLLTWQQAVSTTCEQTRRAEKPPEEQHKGKATREGVAPAAPASGQQQGNVPALPGLGASVELGRGRRGYVRQVAELVRQVAEAAHALHEKGIVHRDITPSNIMVSSDATTATLMDLGLAQLADEVQGRLTRTRQFVGTLRYASPEQVLAVARLERTSDVYSLGATLWELLTLRPLYDATDDMPTPVLMQKIQIEEPARVRGLNPGVPRDLVAIVEKCLQKDPRKRYATAQELAADLGWFLAGEPVRARPVSGLERAWKWARRRPAIAGLVVAIVLAAGGLLGGWAYFTASLAERNQQLTEEQGKTNAALERSRQSEKSAREQRQLALKTVRRVIDDIHARLKDRPGHKELRKALLARALEGLKEVARAADTAAQVDHETLWVHLELGDVFLEIEEGGTAEAKKQFETAHEVARQLAKADPQSAQAQRDLSVSYNKLGNVQLQMGDSKAALESYKKGLEVRERLAKADPQSAQAQRDLSISYNNLGDVQMELGDSKAALESYKKGLEVSQRLAKADPSSAQAQRDLSISYDRLGDVQMRLGDSKAALESYKKGLQVRERLAKADPSSAQAQRDLSISYNNLGNAQMQMGDSKAALESYKKGLEVSERLAKADPQSAQAQRDLFVSYNKLGDVQMELGDSKAALESYKKGLEVSQRLAKADPQSAQAQRDLSISYNNLGNAQMQMGDSKAALESYKKGLEVSQRLAKADPKSAQAQRDLSVSYNKLGDVQLQMGDSKAALESYKKGLEVRERLAKADPQSAQAQRDLSVSYDRLGDVQMQLGDSKAALESYKKNLEVSERLAKADPSSAQAQRDLSISYNKLGDVQMRLGDSKAALESYKKDLEVSERLAKADPSSAQAQRDLLVSYFKLGNLEQQAGEFSKASDWYSKALEIPQRFPKPDFFKQEVAVLERRLRFSRAVAAAIIDPATALKQPEELRLSVLTAVITALARQKKPDKALVAADLLAANAKTAGHLYDAACGYALCVPLADKPEAREQRAARAVELLRQAVTQGYKNAANMRKDSDLDALRQRDDFKKLLAELDKTQSK